ncbi:hypothetical protein GDO86_000580 [Hymenochirus boettgeri]|uniref:RRM domain-containing protein n=1 Tax=Hymenochirus boettgeri TaxID=247094 RepID=A0A8T2KI03_9PIPI|nr:hypothetical protein GDO86_000580 [Hymenochirus boettgeri]
MVWKQLDKVNINKAPGPDGLHPRILKKLISVLSRPLFLIFSDSLWSADVPLDWKKANVIPIFKKGSRSQPGNYRPLWGHTIQVDWADPEKEVDEETMQRVKVLYVRNLMISTTEEVIKAEFNKFKFGAVERVKKIKDYAFVHFFNREDAITAMSVMNGKCIEGASIEITLAKPVNKVETSKHNVNGQKSINSESLQNFVSKEGSKKSPGICSSLLTCLNGQTNPSFSELERCTYPLFPGIKLAPINMYSLKMNNFHSAVFQLDYLCKKNNWALPEYYLYSSTSQDGKMLLIYKVVMPAISSNTNSYFMPDKLCTIVERCKELAAQFTLLRLGK